MVRNQYYKQQQPLWQLSHAIGWNDDEQKEEEVQTLWKGEYRTEKVSGGKHRKMPSNDSLANHYKSFIQSDDTEKKKDEKDKGKANTHTHTSVN